MKAEFSDTLNFLHENLENFSSTLVPLWHPLGFVSCVIDELPSSHVVRVHYWPKSQRRVKNPDWPIHTHTYRLRSLVLAGEVRDIQYRISPEVNGASTPSITIVVVRKSLEHLMK